MHPNPTKTASQSVLTEDVGVVVVEQGHAARHAGEQLLRAAVLPHSTGGRDGRRGGVQFASDAHLHGKGVCADALCATACRRL